MKLRVLYQKIDGFLAKWEQKIAAMSWGQRIRNIIVIVIIPAYFLLGGIQLMRYVYEIRRSEAVTEFPQVTAWVTSVLEQHGVEATEQYVTKTDEYNHFSITLKTPLPDGGEFDFGMEHTSEDSLVFFDCIVRTPPKSSVEETAFSAQDYAWFFEIGHALTKASSPERAMEKMNSLLEDMYREYERAVKDGEVDAELVVEGRDYFSSYQKYVLHSIGDVNISCSLKSTGSQCYVEIKYGNYLRGKPPGVD